MLVGIPNETCAGLKKLSTWFGMRSLQKKSPIFYVSGFLKENLAHEISSQ